MLSPIVDDASGHFEIAWRCAAAHPRAGHPPMRPPAAPHRPRCAEGELAVCGRSPSLPTRSHNGHRRTPGWCRLSGSSPIGSSVPASAGLCRHSACGAGRCVGRPRTAPCASSPHRRGTDTAIGADAPSAAGHCGGQAGPDVRDTSCSLARRATAPNGSTPPRAV